MPFRRRSIRLKGFDYAGDGAYFVTVCTYQRCCFFGSIQEDTMLLNSWGNIVENCWYALDQHFEGIEVDTFVVMPNHIHGIVIINRFQQNSISPNPAVSPDVGAQHAAPLQSSSDYEIRKIQRPNVTPGSLGIIVGSFKSAVTKTINEQYQTPTWGIWQRGYHDRIIRQERELNDIRGYIKTNPARWTQDSLYVTT